MAQAGPEEQPEPEGGWSEGIETLRGAVVVPPVESGFVQAAGVLRADGSYCAAGALWRKFRPLTTEPARPSQTEPLAGRWLWGGVLWVHFGHFLVESTSRLWALNALEAPVDGILFIPKRPKAGDMTRGFQRAFVDQLAPGLPIRVATDPLEVEELVVPGQGFGLGRITAGTPAFRAAIHDRFGREIEPVGPDRLYVSRSALGLGKGGLLGEERLEALLAEHGYETFHPQQHSIEEQLARYKAASKIIAADGSAVHLYAMVGRADQDVAIVLRRKSTAHNLLAANVSGFCGTDPLMIDALRTEWVKAEGKKKSNRLSFGELDHPAIARALSAGGFIPEGTTWPATTKAEREAMMREKGLAGSGRFVEAPQRVKERIRAERRARRAENAQGDQTSDANAS